MVEVELDNDSVYNLSAEYLRISSPAVDSTIRSVGGDWSYMGGDTRGSLLLNLLELWGEVIVR